MIHNKKWIVFSLGSLCILGIWYYFFSQTSNEIQPNITRWDTVQKKREYKHTYPEPVIKKSYFHGEFIANDSVSIYPRRSAIVKDILVDIGDRVYKWQTLALLQSPWVAWESAAKIQVKNTLLQNTYNTLWEAKKVKQAKIEKIDQQIIQQQEILEKTNANFDAQIQQLWDKNTSSSEYSILESELKNLKYNLNNAKLSKKEILQKWKNNIKQKQDLFSLSLDDIFQKIIVILYIWESSEIDYHTINPYDISDQLWAKNTQLTKQLTSIIRQYQSSKNDIDITQSYKDISQINILLIQVLENTISSVDITQKQIENAIADINTFDSKLLQEFESIQNAQDNYQIDITKQQEKIENLERLIEKKKNQLALSNNKYQTLLSEKSLVTQNIISVIKNLEESKKLLLANEEKMITDIENQISLAQVELQETTLKSWDYQIISDFSGIISQRNISIWENISTSREAFRLTDVDNSLSKKTKKEIKFFVQEDVIDDIQLWNTVIFNPAWAKNKSYTGSIYRISPEIDSKTLSITVQAKVNGNINIPNKATIRVEQENIQDIFKIPSTNIYNKWERTIIYYKKDNGKIGIRDIIIISEDGEYSLITGNITPDLPVITTKIFTK